MLPLQVIFIYGYICVPFQILGLLIIWRARSSIDKIMLILMSTLCAVEIQVLTLMSTRLLLGWLGRNPPIVMRVISVYIDTGLCFAYYSTMVLFTLNRFCKIFFSYRYQSRCTVKKVKYILCAVYAVAIAMTVTFCVVDISASEIERYCYTFFYPFFNLSALLCILFTYAYVCYKFYSLTKPNRFEKHRRRRTSTYTISNQHAAMKKRQAFRGSVMPTIFIAAFLFFIVIPDSVNCYMLNMNIDNAAFSLWLVMSYFTGFLFDTVIYIFMSPSMRSDLKQLLCCNTNTSREASTNDTYTNAQSPRQTIDGPPTLKDASI